MRSIYLFLFLVSTAVNAQDKIIANVEGGKPFITKTVTAGESFFSLGRHFSLAPKDVAAFNKIDVTKGLNVGQTIKLPLTKANLFIAPCATCTGVYYQVPPKEGLYRIAINFNNIGIPALKKLNNLTTDNVAIGQNLLVGYLKDAEGKTDNLHKEEVKPTVPVKIPPVIKVIEDGNMPIKPAERKEIQADIKDTVYAVKETILDANMAKQGLMPIADLQKSAFAQQYLGKNDAQKKGTAAIFKSTSGWNDNKFYVLMSGVVPGTIVKVTAINSNKAIIAKVLGELPAIKQNEGLLMRISNAAANVLGGADENVEVVVGY